MFFQQSVTTAITQYILLPSVHADDIRALLGVTKTVEKVSFRFCCPVHSHDIEVFVARCFFGPTTSVPRKNVSMVLEDANLVFFSTSSCDFLGPSLPRVANQNIRLIDDVAPKSHEAVVLPNQSAPTKTKALVD